MKVLLGDIGWPESLSDVLFHYHCQILGLAVEREAQLSQKDCVMHYVCKAPQKNHT